MTTSLVRTTASVRIEPALQCFLLGQLGVWLRPRTLRIAPSARRMLPDWDGNMRPVVGVTTGRTLGRAAVFSIPPLHAAAVRDGIDRLGPAPDVSAVAALLPAAVGRPQVRLESTVLRWATTTTTVLPEIGFWRSAHDLDLPEWLRRFSGQVLVASDNRGRFQGGVGIKRLNGGGREIAVGTAPAFRGRGIATALVAQAVRRIVSRGGVALYRHDPDNLVSARTAAAAGLPDRGWRWHELIDPH